MSERSKGKPKKDYAVGYGKPPREHQWKKGQSGNGGGRKPALPRVLLPEQMRLDLLERLERLMLVTTADGRSVWMPTILAIQEVHIRKALAGHSPNWRQLQADYKALLAQTGELEPKATETFNTVLESIARDEPTAIGPYYVKHLARHLRRRYASPTSRERKPVLPKKYRPPKPANSNE